MSIAEQLARALCSPFVPSPVREISLSQGYLEAIWPQLQPSVRTSGFLGSALYIADMSLNGVEAVYEPLLSRESLRDHTLSEEELDRLVSVLDVFHRVQPQLLLLFAALGEAWERPQVGGMGRSEVRIDSYRDLMQLRTTVPFVPVYDTSLLEIVRELQLKAPPDLYRAVASFSGYLPVVWGELRHLVTYPEFRRRGRALYYYARASSRFLASPLTADRATLRQYGLAVGDLDALEASIEGVTSSLAMMVMHCSAMRVGLGLTSREVVQRD